MSDGTSQPQRPRVLVIAEAANPEWVSVPLVGWSLSQALREVADVHLVTQVRNRDAILRAGLTEGDEFTAIDTEWAAKAGHKLAERLRMGANRGWTTVRLIESLLYPVFERTVWKQFGADIKGGKYDLVHRVTPLSPTANSLLARKCRKAGVPFVMGPLNGGVPWPKEFVAAQVKEREFLSFVRNVYKLNPFRRQTLNNAKAIVVGSRHTGSEIPDALQGKTIFIPENAVDPQRFNQPAMPYESGPVRGCFIGRLVPYKGCDMLIEAAQPMLADGRMTLDVLGDGPELAALKEQAQTLGVADAVTFHGWVEHQKVQDVARNAHLLTFPSIREFGGGVVLEAMALGLVPVICDYAGPAELVTDETGFKVPMGTRDQIVAKFRETLDSICQTPSQLAPMAQAARTTIQDHFTWSAKARQLRQVYDWALQGTPKPEPLSGHIAKLAKTV